MFVLVVLCSLALALALAASAVRKARSARTSVALRDRLGVPPAVWSGVAVPEAVAAAGLVAGLCFPPLGIAAAAGVVLLMAAAVLVHLGAGVRGVALAPPVGVSALAVLVVVLHLANT
ncbi:DoxX family protein [Asanoa sp. WMMD1127]|uniref:DoxX family protein n=1 Tax=Asanoa sp. WMMD1127 TaxID=3016107 RepID=UPI002416D02E|nr:DoxX family protein [Asanoa sp. WMMD1127]MDG4825317.1 DoxX family protein [Asanoa sp. WMMD1127]